MGEGGEARAGLASAAVRIALTAALLAALGLYVDWRAVGALALEARPEWLAAAALCIVGVRVLITLRWGLILAAAGAPAPFRRVLRVVFAGMGLGLLIPTSIGPDIAKGVLLHADVPPQLRPPPSRIVASLLLDRFISGLGGLLVALAAALALGEHLVAAAVLAAIAAAVGAATVFAMAGPRVVRRLTPRRLQRLCEKICDFAGLLRAPEMLRIAPIGLGISMLKALARCGLFLALYQAFDAPAPILLALMAIPLMFIALIIPLTVGGLGVREGVLVLSFAAAPEVSVSVGLMAFALEIALSLPALLALAAGRHLSKPLVETAPDEAPAARS